MRRDGHLVGCRIRIYFAADAVTLEGEVASFYQKSLAQHFVLRVLRERHLPQRVANLLMVR